MFWVIFWDGHQQFVCFLQRSTTIVDAQDGSGELFCSNGGGDTLQAFLEGALGQKALCQQ